MTVYERPTGCVGQPWRSNLNSGLENGAAAWKAEGLDSSLELAEFLCDLDGNAVLQPCSQQGKEFSSLDKELRQDRLL